MPAFLAIDWPLNWRRKLEIGRPSAYLRTLAQHAQQLLQASKSALGRRE